MVRFANARFLMLFILPLLSSAGAWSWVKPEPESSGDETVTRTLYLIRHAKSDKSIAGLEDFARPLDSSGVEDARLMATFLLGQDLCMDQIIYSPSVRTTQTLELLFGDEKYSQRRLGDSTVYRCTDEAALAALSSAPEDVNCLALIGHNPTMTNLANRFQKEKKFDELPTCGVVAIELKLKSWSEIRKANGRLIFWNSPRKLSGK
jgi:phosphohistidine phosphatase